MRCITGPFTVAVAVLVLAGTPLSAEAEDAKDEDLDHLSALASMSLEDLAEIEISSVSKRLEKRTSAAAAVHVITAEDIRRSAATNLPDLLRMVPGVHVANLDANKKSVSIRGFGGRFAFSLQVLVDGRSIYNPLFSGVEWEFIDPMLENIERIEIIRGPGGTLWGANAVNGVINIVTKDAADTQGGLLSLGAGTEYPGMGAVRYGGKAGEHGHYRLHLRYFRRDEAVFEDGRRARDDALNVRGGTRLDWDWGADQLMLAANLYGGHAGQTLNLNQLDFLPVLPNNEAASVTGGHVLGRWTRATAGGGELQVKAYYDRWQSNRFITDEDRDIFDFELQYRMAPAGRHEWMIGAGFRYYDTRTEGSSIIQFRPAAQRRRLFSAFIQDRIAFLDDTLILTLGTKVEHNDFTEFEIQPNARLAWTPSDRHTVWAAVSRAVRTPSVVEDTVRNEFLGIPGFTVAIYGDGNIDAEDLLALEGGYRVRPLDTLSLDLALFYHRYDNLRTLEVGAPFLEPLPLPPHVAVPLRGHNNMKGRTYGVELAADWQAAPWWRLHLNHSTLEMDLEVNAETIDIISGGIDESSPEQQVFLGSYMDLGEQVELDVFLRYVDQLPALGIDDYLTADVRLAWRPRDDFEIEVVGHDLLQPEHAEFDSMFVNTVPTRTQRGIYGKVTWRF